MSIQTPFRLRSSTSVLGRAVLVGAVSAIPAVMVTLPALSAVQAMVGGASLGQTWLAVGMTDEDWEMVPALLLSAVLIGALVGATSAVVWLAIVNRVHGRPWIGRLAAALTAAAVPILLLVLPNWQLAIAAALPASLIAFVAAPRVGYQIRTVQ